jgi:hypothetical protein
MELRGWRGREAREDHIVRRVIICYLHQLLLGRSNQRGWAQNVARTKTIRSKA